MRIPRSSFLLIALLTLAALMAGAQVTSPCTPGSLYCSLDNLHLVKTRLVMSTAMIALQCNTSPCQSLVPLFGKPTNVVCPGPVGQVCTFDAQIGALATQSPGDVSDVDVTVSDGVVLTPSVYPLAVDPPGNGSLTPDSILAPFTLYVKNTSDNERHLVTILARLQGLNPSNSTHSLILQGPRLRLDVFKP